MGEKEITNCNIKTQLVGRAAPRVSTAVLRGLWTMFLCQWRLIPGPLPVREMEEYGKPQFGSASKTALKTNKPALVYSSFR